MQDGDILVYRDINCLKNPSLGNFHRLKEVAQQLLNRANFDFLITRETENIKLRQHCKKSVIQQLGVDREFSYEFPLLVANFIIIRKSTVSMELLNEWLNACKNQSWIDGSVHTPHDSQFKWHTCDQAILNTIIAKWILQRRHKIPENYPNVICRNRNHLDVYTPHNYRYLELLKQNAYSEQRQSQTHIINVHRQGGRLRRNRS
jgi:hypothetical protein